MGTRGVIYTRVSSDPNDRGRSVAEQEAECRAVCSRNSWDVVAVYSDNDRSASRYATKQRPEHRKLIRYIEAGEADVLVTWEASRAARPPGVCRPAGSVRAARGAAVLLRPDVRHGRV